MKKILLKSMMLLCLLFVGMGAWADVVTYTVTSTSAVSTSGTAPQGSSATYSSTYTTKAQLTSGKSMTLTLSGYSGKKITGITLSMKSNASAGAGYLSAKAGSTTLASIGTSGSGVAFNNAAWNGSYTTTYTDVTPTMTNNSYVIKSGESVVIVIGATTNSLYCESFKISYLDSGIPCLGTPTNLASTNVTDRSATLTWDAVSNASSYMVKVGSTEYETNTNSYTVMGLDYNTDYSWSVKALAGSSLSYSDGNYSDESNFRTTDFVVSAGTYDIVPSNTFFNCNTFSTKPSGFTGATGTRYGVTIEYVAATNAYIISTQCRAYNGTKLNFTAPDGYKLTNITFTADGNNWDGTHTSNVGTMTNTKTWDGCSDAVSITFAGTSRITNIQVTYIPASADITVSAAGYTTYFNSTTAYTMPADCEGYVFTAANGLELAYEAEEVVPAGEPLVIYTIEPGPKTLEFTTSDDPTWKELESNDLEGTDEETALEADANSYFYGLSLNAAGETNSVGFYWMEENGAAFTNGAHKAYLKLPQTPGAKSAFRFNNTTGIKTLNNEQSVNKAVKRIMNGQLVIEKAGKMFNAAGAEMK